MIRLRKIDHVCLRVADVASAAQRYAIQFGLTIREQDAARALLACDYEPYSLELAAASGDEPLGFAHCAWQLRRSVSLDDDAFVSSVHARIFVVDGEAYLEDLNSKNGTYLNEEPVTTLTQLERGDLVRVGDTVFELRR